MNRTIITIFRICVSLCVLLFLSCTADYNPFEDTLNAEGKITWASFVSGDTIAVFSSETLLVSIAGREMVDSIVLTCDANRLFNSDTSVRADNAVDTFCVSFYDTGAQTVTVATFRSNGEVATTMMDVFVRSPLLQNVIAGIYDDTIRLSTPGVRDNDVLYHWDFGKGTPVQSPYPETLIVIRDAGATDTGWLWVSDIPGIHSSPKIPFLFTLDDSRAPTIRCVNEDFENADTIVTGEETFFFKVEITDRGKGGVYIAEIDGENFDIVDDMLYVKIFYQMDTLAQAIPVQVYAVDNGIDQNVQLQTFYLRYDSTISSTGDNVNLHIRIPSQDSVVSYARQTFVYGTVENFRGDSLVAFLQVNDSTYDTLQIGNTFSSQWNWEVYLTQAVNLVTISIADTTATVLKDSTFTLFYDENSQDVSPPLILDISIDGQAADGMYVESDTVTLDVIAFDEGSGLSSLTVQNQTNSGQLSGDYTWPITVQLSHEQSGTNIEILATDAQGWTKDTAVTVYQNYTPQFSDVPNPSGPLFVGQLYRDTVRGVDADGDQLFYGLVNAPLGMSLNNVTGELVWTPADSNIGNLEIKISMSDLRQTQVVSCSLTVVDSSTYGESVSFVTTEQSFPTYVEGGVDTVALSLEISGGISPFVYLAKRRVGSTLPDIPMMDTVFFWVPDSADTGFQSFIITVSDKYNRADTLYPSMLVVPANKPCSLSVEYHIDTLPGGALDLSQVADLETLTYVIGDPDPDISEEYAVTIQFNGRQDIRTVQGVDTFLVIINPDDVDPAGDTVTVVIVDRGGNADTLSVALSPGRVYNKVLIDVAASGISEDLYDVPVLVRLSSEGVNFDLVQSDGSDIRFKKADGTYLYHEIDEWDNVKGRWVVWVRVDTIHSSSASQYFYMQSKDTVSEYVSDGTKVFNVQNGFVGVWHFSGQDLGNAVSSSHACEDYSTDTIAGIHGTARVFASGSHLRISHSTDFNTPNVTFSCWMKLSTSPPNWNVDQPRLWDKTRYPNTTYDAFQVALNRDPPHSQDSAGVRLVGRGDTSASERSYSTSGAVDSSTERWQYVSVVATPTSFALYMDGILDNEGTCSFPLNYSSEPVYIGDNPTAVRAYDGLMDEVRYSGEPRSASWVRFCYENQKAESDLVSVVEP